MKRYTMDFVQRNGATTTTLETIQDAHVAPSLVRTFYGVSKMNYLLRTIAPAAISIAAAEFDPLVDTTLRVLSAGPISDASMHELTLPVTTTNTGRFHFGIFLTSAQDTAHSAYLASFVMTATIARD